jgi:energy-coupling factor transporter ATPase
LTPIIRLEDVEYTYDSGPESQSNGPPIKALDGVSLTIERGEYLAIVGHNGSGKSTLAKHLNGLLLPTGGDVWVKEWNTRDRRNMRAIRSTVGMVFQTPDNQIVATIVEEDVAFGPENLGVPHDEIVERVDWSLEQVDMTAFRHRVPHMLSGGQKQRVCIAGMLAMRPDVLVLDEATAMLDPLGRKEVLSIARRLNQEAGTTIVAITHFMGEAVDADRMVVMSEGRVVLDGPPRELFQEANTLRSLHIGVPQITRLAQALHRVYPQVPNDILTEDELVQAVLDAGIRVDAPPSSRSRVAAGDGPGGEDLASGKAVIRLEGVSHRYMRGTPLEVLAISDVNLSVRSGEVVGIIGHTGSGKSTIVQHFNALLRPYSGHVFVNGHDTEARDVDVRAIRREVGLVFQEPESQLFERYVGDDVAYGPRNLKLSREDVRERVRNAMESVGLGFEDFKDRMTFGLSGGQMRRVALAGVLALRPSVLVLDEPTAGLDPEARRQLLDLILALRNQGITLSMISHNMEEQAEICDRLIVIAGGTTVMEGSPSEIFAQADRLRELGLDVPAVTSVVNRLIDAGVVSPNCPPVYTVNDAMALFGCVLETPGPDADGAGSYGQPRRGEWSGSVEGSGDGEL